MAVACNSAFSFLFLFYLLQGALGTMLGALAGYAFFGSALGSGLALSSDAPKLAAALCAKNIGGGVNFVAVITRFDFACVPIQE